VYSCLDALILLLNTSAMHNTLEPFLFLFFVCQEQEINDELEFLIIASDGLWDVVPNEVSLPSTSLTCFGLQISLCLLFFLGICVVE